MAYRGEDLDLRTPQSWGAAGRDTVGAEREPNWWTRTTIYKGGRGDPIWVDDTVMECSNHAYDLAVAHRSPEVRLEHMINALTLNDHAMQVLEARGIGIASLRRESGSVIASGLPTASSNGHGPKRSEALEETLRLAADQAYPRRSPVTVEDLLHVLFDAKRDLPGQQLLHRHVSRWPGRNGAEPRGDYRLEPLPHLASGYDQADRYVAPEASRPRFSQPAQDYFNKPAAPAGRPPREPQRSPRPDRDAPPVTVDNIQNNRIEALERAVRDFGLDLADERKSLQTLVSDLQRNAAAQADDTNRFRGGLTDRLNTLEDTLNRNWSDQAVVPPALIDRISSIERSMESRLAELGDYSPLQATLLDRIASIEQRLEQRLTDLGRATQLPAALIDRITVIERNVEAKLSDIARSWSIVVERLQAMESIARRPVEATMPPHLVDKLDRLERLLPAHGVSDKLGELDKTYQLILDRMVGLERRLPEDGELTGLELAPFETRVSELEHKVVSAIETAVDLSPVADLMSSIETRVASLERSVENRTAETGRTVSFIGERLRSFEELISDARGQSGEHFVALQGKLDKYTEVTNEAGATHQRDLAELHEALLKLNANQQTLATSLDQWRLDNTGDISVLANRLKSLEDSDQRRIPALEAISHQISDIYSAIAKREVRKSRFRQWLFGTEEWYSASYDTENWRARQNAEAIRGLEARGNVAPLQRQTPPPTPARRA